jgi:hypothetical protein
VRGSPVVFPDFSGGLNLVADPADLAPNESFDALNVRPTQDGSVYRRDRVSPMGVTFGGQIDYLYAGGIYLFAVGFGRLESMTYNPTVRTVISTSASLNRFSAMFTAPASGGQGPHYLIGQSGALSTDGTTALSYTASAGSLPAAAIAVWHQQRVFAARLLTSATTDPSSTVVASNIGDPRDWTQGTSQGWTAMFGPGDGDPITAMVGAGQYLFVFKRNKVWVVYDLDTGANRRVSADVGAVSGRSVVVTPSGIFFYSQRGVMVMDLAGSSVTPISHKIDPAIVLEPLGSYSTYDLYQGAYLNNSYYLAVISASPGATRRRCGSSTCITARGGSTRRRPMRWGSSSPAAVSSRRSSWSATSGRGPRRTRPGTGAGAGTARPTSPRRPSRPSGRWRPSRPVSPPTASASCGRAFRATSPRRTLTPTTTSTRPRRRRAC